MNADRPDRGDYPPHNSKRMLAIIGVCVGGYLLLFGTPAGFPPLTGPAAGGFWPVLAIVCLVLGLIAITDGFHTGRSDEKSTARTAHMKADQPPSEDIEAKLRQLLRLREEKLITEDEYNRKRADI